MPVIAAVIGYAVPALSDAWRAGARIVAQVPPHSAVALGKLPPDDQVATGWTLTVAAAEIRADDLSSDDSLDVALRYQALHPDIVRVISDTKKFGARALTRTPCSPKSRASAGRSPCAVRRCRRGRPRRTRARRAGARAGLGRGLGRRWPAAGPRSDHDEGAPRGTARGAPHQGTTGRKARAVRSNKPERRMPAWSELRPLVRVQPPRPSRVESRLARAKQVQIRSVEEKQFHGGGR